jgi:phosphoglycerate dehydrogenase-like enzyme
MNKIIEAHTRPLVVASQLGNRLNEAIGRRVENLTIFDVPLGALDESSLGAEVVFAAPIHSSEVQRFNKPPRGWPGAIRWIQLISVGIDGYPQWMFDGPVVSSARGPSAQPMAEFALAAIFSAAKRFPEIWVEDAQEWDQKKFYARDIAGTTLGLVGFGAIGQRLAELALALRMRVVATRRTAEPLNVDGVQRVTDVREIMAQSDHVVLLAPATPETDHIINRDTLASAKPGLHLINIARGSLIDNEALLDSIAAGKVGLASLDVTDPEPLPPNHRFYTHPRIRLSAHVSMHTEAALAGLVEKFVDNTNRYRRGVPLLDVVNIARGY